MFEISTVREKYAMAEYEPLWYYGTSDIDMQTNRPTDRAVEIHLKSPTPANEDRRCTLRDRPIDHPIHTTWISNAHANTSPHT